MNLENPMRDHLSSWQLRQLPRDLRNALRSNSAKTFVEVGSFAGESSEIFAQELPFMTVYCIDPWVSGYDPADSAPTSNMDQIETLFDERTGYLGNLVKFKGVSTDYPDLIPDMVYIDGDHRYEAVKADIQFWLPRIKKGGIISGHDFHTPETCAKVPHIAGVRKAVLELVGEPTKKYGDGSWYKQL